MAKGFRYGGAGDSSSEKSLVLPSNPTITLKPDDGKISIMWDNPKTESTIAKYKLYHSTTKPDSLKDMTFVKDCIYVADRITSGVASVVSYTEDLTGLTNDITHYIGIQSVDVDGYENASIWEVKNGKPTALKWVVGTNYGYVYTSTDGLNWTESNLNSGASANYTDTKLAYGKGVFVCLLTNTSNTCKIMYSTDGTNWSLCGRASEITNSTFSDIAYSENLKRFVAVGPSIMAWSDTGTYWYKCTGQSNQYNYRNVVAGDTAFLAFGYAAPVYISTDGKSWTASTGSWCSTYEYDEGAYGHNVLLKTYNNGSYTHIYMSINNGSGWGTVNTSTFGSSMPKLYYSKDAFYAIDTSQNRVLKTIDDGVTWTVISKLGTGKTALGFYSGAGVLVGTNSGMVMRYDDNFTGYSSATLPCGKKVTAFCSNKP